EANDPGRAMGVRATTITATAQRLDVRGTPNELAGAGITGGGRMTAAPELPPSRTFDNTAGFGGTGFGGGGLGGAAGEFTIDPAGGGPLRPADGQSRLVDTVPVSDRGTIDVGDDAMVLPSAVRRRADSLVDDIRPRAADFATADTARPRRAEAEMVGGRPVFVLYRPSRGLEVADTEMWDTSTPVRQ
ncbi:MAG: hypothetical protein J2O49_05445, partial [Sciscionella sp.]|nr:hypothetical protein [Sciscionella sp.]